MAKADPASKGPAHCFALITVVNGRYSRVADNPSGVRVMCTTYTGATDARASYVSHEGSKPISLTWKLNHRLPLDWFHEAGILAG